MSKLDFPVVENNNKTLYFNILDENDKAVDGTSLAPLTLKWQWFIDGGIVTKSSSQISVITLNPLVVGVALLAADTLGKPEGSYPHEMVTVDTAGNPVTVTNNDPRLSWGVGYLRKQKTVQA